jgi:hypothetical protein
VVAHEEGIARFAEKIGAPLVFSSGRHYERFASTRVPRYLCLIGDEYAKVDHRALERDPMLQAVWVDAASYYGLPESSPLNAKLFDAGAVPPLGRGEDAVLGRACPFGVALSGALAAGWSEVYLVGFDGYAKNTTKARALTAETQGVFDRALAELPEVKLWALTPSSYAVPHRSLYGLLAGTDSAP